ncbi:cupin 2, conserved barrel domain protein [Baffinella frigidus]|nr:cupin 2, conserved barrel domain protein [Cryptophyta sp. CCMP2293]|eukprot:CAMPEP_0180132504 /NCGR_PEP_ID=MMETSP0986-20121125/9021_1 /TAXON_ID=697907 /ORGANISM="non described non described, Strain CCMP2293" /LENGTH=123 /DNA_ID=CAMNT_0022072517 /DNA_START=45 /DNA_END=416 /DNA_ORIENTATION=+
MKSWGANASCTTGDFSKPLETKKPVEGVVMDTVAVGTAKCHRICLGKGWKWSKDMQPLVGGTSCQRHHLGYVSQGVLGVNMVHGDGKETIIQTGQVYDIPPGHDAWTVGDTAVIVVEFDQPTV